MKAPVSTWAKLSVVLFLSLIAGGAQAFELRGFRGVSWGEGIEALGAATVVQTVGEVTCYQRQRENMLFGDTPLNGVRFCFHRDRLFMVTLDAAVAPKAFVAEFEHTYGRPASRRGQTAAWGTKGSGTRADLAAIGNAATRLTIYSNKIEPSLARRMQKLSPAELPNSLAASRRAAGEQP